VSSKRTVGEPFVIIEITPIPTTIIPSILYIVIFSLYKNLEIIIMKMGKVIEIKERFIAVVVCPATYISVLKTVIPKMEVIIRYKKCFLKSFQSFNKLFIAKGVKAKKAIIHLQNANEIGGIVSDKSLATIKFPDHMAVAISAKIYP